MLSSSSSLWAFLFSYLRKIILYLIFLSSIATIFIPFFSLFSFYFVFFPFYILCSFLHCPLLFFSLFLWWFVFFYIPEFCRLLVYSLVYFNISSLPSELIAALKYCLIYSGIFGNTSPVIGGVIIFWKVFFSCYKYCSYFPLC